jgi:hypothetical protein
MERVAVAAQVVVIHKNLFGAGNVASGALDFN